MALKKTRGFLFNTCLNGIRLKLFFLQNNTARFACNICFLRLSLAFTLLNTFNFFCTYCHLNIAIQSPPFCQEITFHKNEINFFIVFQALWRIKEQTKQTFQSFNVFNFNSWPSSLIIMLIFCQLILFFTTYECQTQLFRFK